MGSQVSVSISISDMSVTNALVSYHHNIFEKHHRFIGWLGLAVCTLKFGSGIGTDKY